MIDDLTNSTAYAGNWYFPRTDTVYYPNAEMSARYSAPSVVLPSRKRCKYCGVNQTLEKVESCQCCGAPL